jgi:hypothetical protein
MSLRERAKEALARRRLDEAALAEQQKRQAWQRRCEALASLVNRKLEEDVSRFNMGSIQYDDNEADWPEITMDGLSFTFSERRNGYYEDHLRLRVPCTECGRTVTGPTVDDLADLARLLEGPMPNTLCFACYRKNEEEQG